MGISRFRDNCYGAAEEESFAVRYNRARYELIMIHIFNKCSKSLVNPAQCNSFYRLISRNLAESCSEELGQATLSENFLAHLR